MRLFESNAVPEWLKRVVINAVINQFPNFAVREFRTRSLPHKLTSVAIEGIAEQRPDLESRITLSDKTDALGMPIARIDWRDDIEARRSLVRLGHHLASELVRIGLPVPQLEDWVIEVRPQDGIIIDSAHAAGTTRMSDDPKQGSSTRTAGCTESRASTWQELRCFRPAGRRSDLDYAGSRCPDC
jgi:hypothetical protein